MLQPIVDSITGTKRPGAPSTGPRKVDRSAFDENQKQKELGRQLADQNERVEGRKFQEMGAAQVGPAAQSQAAQVGQYGQMNAAQINQAQQGQTRAQQMGLANALTAQMQGQGPSLAQMQLKSATDRGIKQSMAMAASQRGLNAQQRARMVGNSAAAMQQDAARASAQTRMAEQLAAQQQLGGVLSGVRGQDIGLAQSQAGLQQQANQANFQGGLQSALANAQMQQQSGIQNAGLEQQAMLAQAQMNQQANQANLAGYLQNQGQNDAMQRSLYGQQLGLAGQQQQSAMAREQLLSGDYNMGRQLAMQQYGVDTNAAQAQQNAILGAAAGGLGAYATMNK